MPETQFKRPSLRQRRRNLIRQLFNGWPWLVWIGAAIAVLLLLPGGMHRIRFYGIAERTYEYVSPLESGRLKSLLVNLGDAQFCFHLCCNLSHSVIVYFLLLLYPALVSVLHEFHESIPL